MYREKTRPRTGECRVDQTDQLEALDHGWKPRCRIPTCQQKYWITSSTFYTTKNPHFGTVASSLNHRSRVPENIFSLASSSRPKQSHRRGRRCSQILQPLPHTTPKHCPLAVPTLSQPQMQNRVVGSRVFLASYTSRWSIQLMGHPTLKR